VAGMPASPAMMSMSPNSVLHHFCADADQPSGSTTHGSLPIPQQLKPSTSSDFLVTPIQPGRRSRWDQLEEGLKDLDASGYQPALGEAHQRLFYLLDSILSTKKSYRSLLQYRDERAQLLVNALQWVSCLPLSSGPLPSSFGRSSFPFTRPWKDNRRES
jgi:hypothetical protein